MHVEVIGGPKDGALWEVPDGTRIITIPLPISTEGRWVRRTMAEFIEQSPTADLPILVRGSDLQPVVIWPKAQS